LCPNDHLSLADYTIAYDNANDHIATADRLRANRHCDYPITHRAYVSR